MKGKLFILILLVILASCRGLRITNPVEETTQTSTRFQTDEEISVSVVDYTKSDSASITVALSVDPISDQIAISSINDYTPGERVIPEIRIRDNFIYIKCRVDSAEIYRRYFKRYYTSHDTLNSQSVTIKELGGTSAGGKIARRIGRFFLYVGGGLVILGIIAYKFRKFIIPF